MTKQSTKEIHPKTVRREVVEAGAGCGKTHSLVSRYLEALGWKWSNEQKKFLSVSAEMTAQDIVALTFTEDAAAEMKQRIHTALLDTIQDPTLIDEFHRNSQVSTFHSYCYRTLQMTHSQFRHLPLYGDFQTSEAVRSLLKSIFSARPEYQSLLDHLPLRTIQQHVFDRLFLIPGKNELKSRQTQFETGWKKVLQYFKTDVTQTIAASVDPKKDSEWWTAFCQAMNEGDLPTAIGQLSFVRKALKNASASDPRLRPTVDAIRDLIKKGWWEAMVHPEVWAHELAHHELMEKLMNEINTMSHPFLTFQAMESALLMELRTSSASSASPFKATAPKLLIIDEFQDTSPQQFEIIERLSVPDTQWYFVGDPKQSIYRFRRADVRLFRHVQTQISNRSLSTNYRSRAPILAFSNCLTEMIFDKALPDNPPSQVLQVGHTCDKKCVIDQHPPIQIIETADPRNALCDLLLRDGQQGQNAVLFRRWREVHRFAERATQLGISYTITGREELLHHPLSHIFLLEVETLLQERDSSLKALDSIWGVRRQNWERTRPSDGIFSYFERFCLEWSPDRWFRGPEWVSAMERALISFIESDNQFAQFPQTFIHQFRSDFSRIKLGAPKNSEGESASHLHLYTIHGSKGLQFDRVFFYDHFKGTHRSQKNYQDADSESDTYDAAFFGPQGEKLRSPSFLIQRHLDQGPAEAEQRRLLYVAMTRAKHGFTVLLEPETRERESTSGLDSTAESPPSILGFPNIQSVAWTDYFRAAWSDPQLQKLRDSGEFTWKKLTTKAPPKDDQNQKQIQDQIPNQFIEPTWVLPHEQFRYASILGQRSEQKDSSPTLNPAPVFFEAFFEGGVSSFLKSQSQHLPTGAGQPRSPSVSAKTVGSLVHEILERWNGTSEQLQYLLNHSRFQGQASVLRPLLQKLSELPQLAEYWKDRETHPDRVRQEFDLYIYDSHKRLSGVADVLWMRSADWFVLIDWKTTRHFSNFHSERRKEIRSQLEIYAQGFREVSRVDIIAVGIGIEDQRVEVLDLN